MLQVAQVWGTASSSDSAVILLPAVSVHTFAGQELSEE